MSKGPYRKPSRLPVGISIAEKIHKRLGARQTMESLLVSRVEQTHEWILSVLNINGFEVSTYEDSSLEKACNIDLKLPKALCLKLQVQLSNSLAIFSLDFDVKAVCEDGGWWKTLQGELYTEEMFFEDILKYVERKT